MNAVLKHNDGENRYEVYFDHDDFHHSFEGSCAIEFDSEEEKKSYMSKFIKEELFSFGVVKLQVCKCCCIWSEKESLWGIHAESAEEALNFFKSELG